MSQTTTAAATQKLGVEQTGIEIIGEAERTAKPRDLFWPWFAANVSVFGISYGSYVLDFGLSFWQATLVTIIGITFSFVLCGVIAIAGKRGSAPTMILSRAPFGVVGQKVPGVISWLTSIGWETFLAIMATLATATIFKQLGWVSGDGTSVKVIACIVVAALIVSASVAGYHIIMKLQSILTWITGIATIGYILLTLSHVKWATVSAIEPGPFQAVIGALVMVMTGFGLGWINIAADWSRYQNRHASGAAIVGWNTLGGALAPVLLVIYGVALAGSDPKLREGIVVDPIGTLGQILPTWFLIPFLVAAILALVSGAVLGIYSSGLTLLSLGVKIPRPAAAGIDGIILTLGTIYVVFFAETFIGPFTSFLITLGVPLAAWAGIMIGDIMLRRRDYDEDSLFNKNGRYGSFDWISIITLVVATIIGWGLVINTVQDAAWNNWQGYLLGPFGLGGREGDWAYANLGVLVALVIGFLVSYFGRRATVFRQETGTQRAARGTSTAFGRRG